MSSNKPGRETVSHNATTGLISSEGWKRKSADSNADLSRLADNGQRVPSGKHGIGWLLKSGVYTSMRFSFSFFRVNAL